MSKNSIKVSPKHGLNPSTAICFFCGQPKNEIILMGRLPKDEKAPNEVLVDYNPCKQCKANWSQGYTLIGVSHTPKIENQPEAQPGLYPTGDYMVMSESGIRKVIPDDIIDEVIEKKICFVDQEIIDAINASCKAD